MLCKIVMRRAIAVTEQIPALLSGINYLLLLQLLVHIDDPVNQNVPIYYLYDFCTIFWCLLLFNELSPLFSFFFFFWCFRMSNLLRIFRLGLKLVLITLN